MKKLTTILIFIMFGAIANAQNVGDLVIYYVLSSNYADNGGQPWSPMMQCSSQTGVNNEISGLVFGVPGYTYNAFGVSNIRECTSESDAESTGECWATVDDAYVWSNVTVLEEFISDNDTASMLSPYRKKSVPISYTDLTNKPTIPTNTSQLTNGSGFLTSEVDGSTTNEIEISHGSTTFSGLTLTTQYTVTHGLPFTPSKVQLQPRSVNAAALFYIDNITSTTFRITFVVVPTLGTNNISFDWFAYR